MPHPPRQRVKELEKQPTQAKNTEKLRFSAHVRAFSILRRVKWPHGGFLDLNHGGDKSLEKKFFPLFLCLLACGVQTEPRPSWPCYPPC